jgi:hypothetical protein
MVRVEVGKSINRIDRGTPQRTPLLACSTGRSTGFAPRRIFATKEAPPSAVEIGA